MTGHLTAASALLAAEGTWNDVPNFPLSYQIGCAIMTALFVWTFAIARDPRGWRRLYQAKFTKPEDFSVNRNKRIDEKLKKYGIGVSMIFLVAAVSMFVLGVTYRYRHTIGPQPPPELIKQWEAQRSLEKTARDAERRTQGK